METFYCSFCSGSYYPFICYHCPYFPKTTIAPATSTGSTQVSKPWGYYEDLLRQNSLVVKILYVNPGQKTSHQQHCWREEHWIVRSGGGLVLIEDETKKLCPGTYIKIPKGAWHRIINDQQIPLILIEVQMGDACFEEDIKRKEDDYGRLCT